jgi:hypothetical protein
VEVKGVGQGVFGYTRLAPSDHKSIAELMYPRSSPV